VLAGFKGFEGKGLIQIIWRANENCIYCLIFNYIDIVIPNVTDTSDLIFKLNMSDYTDDVDMLSGEIENFRFNLIKAPVDNLYPAFYHYCFNFYPYLLRALVKPLHLDYDIYGLHYIINGNKKITLSTNLQEILDFLNIDFKLIYGINIPYKNQLFQTIIDSYYFDSNSFDKTILKEVDPMYKENEKYYKEFLSIIPIQELDINRREFLNMLDESFPNSNFYEQISKLKIKDDFEVKEIKKEIANNIMDSNSQFDGIKSAAESRKMNLIDNRKKIKLKRMKQEDLKYRIEGDTIILEDPDDNQ